MQTTTAVSHITRVVVSVRDHDRAIDWYTAKLGFEKTADVPFGDGDRWVELTPAGGGVPLALGRPPKEHLDAATGTMTGVILHTDDADAAYASLTAGGVDADPVMRAPGAPALFFIRDGDGNTLIVAESAEG
jgi:catechol 2,3-dioxygenase-like lactoylglutathione lyase family enzyme